MLNQERPASFLKVSDNPIELYDYVMKCNGLAEETEKTEHTPLGSEGAN